jgi:hypothetical protein
LHCGFFLIEGYQTILKYNSIFLRPLQRPQVYPDVRSGEAEQHEFSRANGRSNVSAGSEGLFSVCVFPPSEQINRLVGNTFPHVFDDHHFVDSKDSRLGTAQRRTTMDVLKSKTTNVVAKGVTKPTVIPKGNTLAKLRASFECIFIHQETQNNRFCFPRRGFSLQSIRIFSNPGKMLNLSYLSREN